MRAGRPDLGHNRRRNLNTVRSTPILSNGNGTARSARIGNKDPKSLLEAVFYYGQNDFQPVPGICSVSVDDVVLLDGKRFKVAFMGFTEEK